MSKTTFTTVLTVLSFTAIPWRWIITFLIALLTLILRYLPNSKKKP